MAAALLADAARRRGRPVEVASAGTAALEGYPPPVPAMDLMMQRGLDISDHFARQLTGPLARRYELILVMEQAQQRWIEGQWPILKGRVHRLGGGGAEDVTDPFGQSREVFEETLRQIETGVNLWSDRLFQ